MPFDLKIVTPENVEIRLSLGGFPSRAGAFFYDAVIQFLILIGCEIAANTVFWQALSPYRYSLMEAIRMGVIFLVVWAYHVFFETIWEGQTPGKKAYGLRVVTIHGQRVEFFASLIRNLLRIVDFLPAFFLTGMTSLLVSENHQRLGDLFARTIVIREKDTKELLFHSGMKSGLEAARPGEMAKNVLEQKLKQSKAFRERPRV